MKKMYIFFALLSFSLFISIVRADTYVTPSAITSLTSNDYNQFNTLIANNNFTNYILYFNYNSDSSRITSRILYTNIDSYTLSCTDTNSYRFYLTNSNSFSRYDLSEDFSSFTYNRDYTSRYIEGGVSPNFSYIILSDMPLVFNDVSNCSSHNYTLSFDNNIYIMPTSYDSTFYTIENIYNQLHADPYPLFTSFFDTVLDKLLLVCEFFTSSYIYLSIFVVIMFYFIILLLRRLT